MADDAGGQQGQRLDRILVGRRIGGSGVHAAEQLTKALAMPHDQRGVVLADQPGRPMAVRQAFGAGRDLSG